MDASQQRGGWAQAGEGTAGSDTAGQSKSDGHAVPPLERVALRHSSSCERLDRGWRITAVSADLAIVSARQIKPRLPPQPVLLPRYLL